jgi:hypothetical protein
MSLERNRNYRRYVKEKVVRKRLRGYLCRRYKGFDISDVNDKTVYNPQIRDLIGTYVHTRQFSTYTGDSTGYNMRYSHKTDYCYDVSPKRGDYGLKIKEKERIRKLIKENIDSWYQDN